MTTLLPNAISLREELISYETLWGVKDSSLKSIGTLFRDLAEIPSRLLESFAKEHLFGLEELKTEVENFVTLYDGFSICVYNTSQYPKRLRDAEYPIALFYYKGCIELLKKPCISIVGARDATDQGKKNAAELAMKFVENGYAIVSGLARGIDAFAMKAAIAANGYTIGVIGTPITEYYPKENRELQDEIAKSHLLISQVPLFRYHNEPFKVKKRYFPERNVTMATLSEATVIVEASERSGTLTQARACFQQGKKLFILESCFENPSITWPGTYEERGAIRVRDFDDMYRKLKE